MSSYLRAARVRRGLGRNGVMVCQFAAYEILYNLGEAALPVLRKIAFGEYDQIFHKSR